MKIGDDVIFTDGREVEHNATVIKVIEEPTNVEQTEFRELCNVAFDNKGTVVNAELVAANDLKVGKVAEAPEPPKEPDAPKEPEPAPTPEPEPSGNDGDNQEESG